MEDLKNLIDDRNIGYKIIRQESFPEPGALTAPLSIVLGAKTGPPGNGVGTHMKFVVWHYNHQNDAYIRGEYFSGSDYDDAIELAVKCFNKRCEKWERIGEGSG